MLYQQLLSTAASALTIAIYYPYLKNVIRGQVKPHMFSWLVWGTTTTLVFFAQWKAGGGVGLWAIGGSGLISLWITAWSWFKQTDLSVSRSDYFFLAGALLSLPFWYITSDPLVAVVILTGVNLLGYGPTFRKVIKQPDTESAAFFAWFSARNVLVIASLEHYSMTTLLFPVSTFLACGLVSLVIVAGRWDEKKSAVLKDQTS